MWTTCSRMFYAYSALWGMRKYCHGSTISNNDHSNEREPSSQPKAEESTLLPKLYTILRPPLCKSKSTPCNASGLGFTNLDSVFKMAAEPSPRPLLITLHVFVGRSWTKHFGWYDQEAYAHLGSGFLPYSDAHTHTQDTSNTFVLKQSVPTC